MANSVTARFNDDCKVFVSMSDDTTVEKAVIIDAEGNETDIGGGGGGSVDYNMAKVTFKTTNPITEEGLIAKTYATIDITPELPEDYTFDDDPPITVSVSNTEIKSPITPFIFNIIAGTGGALLQITCNRVGVDTSNSTYSGDISWNSDFSGFAVTGDCEIIMNNA